MDEDPPDIEAGFIYSWSSSAPGPDDEPDWVTDPEEFVWHLRSAGVDEATVEEAQDRFAEGHEAAWAWLASKRPIAEPLLCECCGLALVDASWRGTAAITCDRCGSVVQLTATDDYMTWSDIAGPSDEWLQEHPIRGRFTVEALTVLNDGVPPIPTDPEPDQYFPVSRWNGADKAVVMFLRRVPDELVPVESGRWEQRLLFFDRDGESWIESYDDAAVTSYNPLDLPDGYFERFGIWFCDLHCDSTDDDPDALWALGGRCGPHVHRIEAVTESSVEVFEPLGPDRFFLATLTGGGRFRFLDAAGDLINGQSMPLDIPTADD